MGNIGLTSLIIVLQLFGSVFSQSFPQFLAGPPNQNRNSNSDFNAGAGNPSSSTAAPESNANANGNANARLTSNATVTETIIDVAATPGCTCNTEITTIVRQLAAEQARLSMMQKRVDDISSLLFSVQNTLNANPQNLQGARTASQRYNIGFSARVGSNRPYLVDTDVIVFDEVIINNGGHYDAYSGKFTANVDGLYQFSSTILSGFNSTIETMIVQDSREMSRLYSGGFMNRGSGTNTVLLNLKPGDMVWVALFFGNGDYVHGQWSTFSGHLVTPGM